MALTSTKRRFASWFVILPMSLSIACGGRSCGTAPAPGQPSETGARALPVQPLPPGQVDSAYRAIESAANEIPRVTFDPQAIVQHTGSAPGKILQWVSESTYWVPYRGALRGPIGVLMDRLGNSLDRSLLLAELLRTSGHTVRLATAKLPEQRAKELMVRLRPAPAAPLSGAGQAVEDSEKIIQRYAKDFGLDSGILRNQHRELVLRSEQLMAEHAKRVEAQSKFLIGAVEKHLMDGPEDVKTLAALSDHWWVQRQDGAQWIDMDPLLANLHQTDFQPPAEQTFAFDRPSGEIPLPAGYVHDLTIRVIVEQWNAVGVTERTALTHTFRPAEKFGEPIRLQNVPLAWPKNPVSVEDRDPRGTLRTTAAKQTEWLPLLRIGDKAIYQASFTEAGELNQKPGVAGRSSQDLKGPLGGFDALGGGEPEPSPGTSHLTAQWIEYETRVPGEVPTVIRRDVFDLFRQEPRSRPSLPDPNPNGETRANRALSLLSSVQILPMVCRLSADYVTFEILSGLIANRQTLAAIRAKHETGDLQAGADEAHRLKPVDEPLLNLAFARFEWNAVSQDVYLDAPNILSSRSILTPSGDVFASLAGFDIVTNNVAVRSGALASPKAIRLTQGIADTNAESLLLNQPAVSNAGEALGLVESSKSPWVLIRREVVPAGIGDAWPSDVRFRIHQALDAGYLVVAPRSLPNQKITNWVWWRIEPKSGETLGMGHLGWGQSMTDRVLMGLAGGLVIGVAAWQICLALRNRTPLSPAAYAKADQECACDAATGGFGILAAALSKNGTVGLAVGLAVKGAICTGTKQP